MGATLDALCRLQATETQLRSIREQIESRQRSIQVSERRAATLERQIADLRDLIRKAQTEADRLELERRTHEEHLGKLRELLNRAKANKEYAAILTQLNTDKAHTLRLEDAVLAALNRVDEQKKKDAELRELMVAQQARSAELADKGKELEARLVPQLRELEAQREDAAKSIPPTTLHFFERACEKHDGEAMAMIEQIHPKRAEYICSGCNMSVPLETVNALQSRDLVQPCQTCSRILYLEAPAGVPAR